MSDPYASHLPVLAEVLETERPNRVLEYGSGDHSTGFFLSQHCVHELVTVEASVHWRNRLEPNPRLKVLGGGNPPASDFNLVFIDDGGFYAEREKTIRAVLAEPHPTVIVHDAEVYRPVFEEFSRDFVIYPTAPDTAVIQATDQ